MTQIQSFTRARVDVLIQEISERQGELDTIKRGCSHSWELVGEKPDLSESLLPGVYIGTTEGPIHRDLRIPRLDFKIECRNCLKSMTVNLGNTCPRCFGRLVDGLLYFREQVFGAPYIYYGVRIRRCPERHFSVGCDEWDQ